MLDGQIHGCGIDDGTDTYATPNEVNIPNKPYEGSDDMVVNPGFEIYDNSRLNFAGWLYDISGDAETCSGIGIGNGVQIENGKDITSYSIKLENENYLYI